MSATHKIRPVQSLHGLWDFVFLEDLDLATFTPSQIAQPAVPMLVPSAFDALPQWAGKRGSALYRRTIDVPDGRRARIEFGAVSMWARVYVDGLVVKEHACGYAPFAINIPPSPNRKRELLVLVDNRFDFARVPMHEAYFDFYQYGGIIREVDLHVLPLAGQPAITQVWITPTAEYRDGGIELTVELDQPGMDVSLLIQFDDAEPQFFPSAPDGETTRKLSLRVPSPQLWSPDAPHLHGLCVRLIDESTGQPIDDYEITFGLRLIEAREGAMWLNGERLQLRGFNRHEWAANTGPCTPIQQMLADLHHLQEMGCNFVRGSHYPQDQRFLDLCDRFGILVWEENLGWGQREPTFASAKFETDHDTSLRAMIAHSHHHPCIIIWGVLNEAGTDADYVRPILEKSVNTIRRLDPSRLVSYASMFALTDRHYDLVDLISLNLYPGWYDCEDHPRPLELIAPRFQACFDHIDAEGFAAKPVLISEIGAEGLYGWHDAHHDFFTEEYQAAYLREAGHAALSHPRCAGIAYWHFSDARTYGGGRSLKRPRTFNNKGVLDEYRRPKLAYQAVREVFRATAGE